MIYTWQKLQWQQWIDGIQSHRIPHALLLTGIAGLGKVSFANLMARSLFCQNYVLSHSSTPEKDCQCHSCQLFIGRTHPNIYHICPESTSKIIKIDEIRAACDFIAQTAVHGQYRLVMVESAHSMNHYAANALLKTLEEPAPQGLIVLMTDQEGALPATVRSRCRRMVFTKPNQEIATAWLNTQLNSTTDSRFLLKLAHGAPLKALFLAEDEQLAIRKILYEHLILLSHQQTNPIETANKLQKTEVPTLLDYYIIWMKDLMHLKLNTGQQQIMNQDFLTALSEMSVLFAMHSLTKIVYQATFLREQIQRGINLNKQLLMETLFYQFQESVSCS